MKLLFLLVFVIFFLSIINMVSAQTNSTSQNSLPNMFNSAIAQYNTYKDTFHNFSISPPDGWKIQSQSNNTNDTLVTFSNHNPSNLADFGVYFSHQKPIPQSIFALTDEQILNQAVSELFDTSQFTILQKNIERFSDGFVIQVISEQKQTTQSTPISEWFLFWLADGRQYYLIMTSSQNGFNQNAAEFEKSVYGFYVGPEKVPSVPEFGPAAILAFTVTLSATLLMKKLR
jgi:hypothetical protein